MCGSYKLMRSIQLFLLNMLLFWLLCQKHKFILVNLRSPCTLVPHGEPSLLLASSQRTLSFSCSLSWEPRLLLASSRRTQTFTCSLSQNPHFYLLPLREPTLLRAPSRRTHTFTCSLSGNPHFYLLPLGELTLLLPVPLWESKLSQAHTLLLLPL